MGMEMALIHRVLLSCALLCCGCAASVDLVQHNGASAPRKGRISVDFQGAAWTQVMSWDFADGEYPGGWGWGDWRIENGLLTGVDTDDDAEEIGVYFFPFAHGDDVILETKVRLLRSAGDHHAEAQLLTRDGREIHSESGMVIVAGEDRVDVRHMVGATQYVRESLRVNGPISCGQWYVMRLVLRDGKMDAFVDGERVFSTIRYGKESGVTGGKGVLMAATVYSEPHVAVRYGEAQFEYVKIFTNASKAPALEASEDSPYRPNPASWAQRHWLVTVVIWIFCLVIFLVCAYAFRHYVFTLNRLFGRQRQPYLDVDAADWPEVTVLIPAHNEEVVIGEILEALLEVDYPPGRLTVLAVNDRSRDRTGEIIDSFAGKHPDRVVPYHRSTGATGKAAVLNDALEKIGTEIILIFDADYIPGRGLIKQLVAPFFDPEVGAVMGRVVPYNVGSNLLTRLLDLERSGGYQVDQQARMNMKMVPQYGGTVGGVRKGALMSVGGWREDSLAEDTDATYRLLLGGWKTVYQNRSECYEQVPETWTSRVRQIMRWAKGHNQATARFSLSLIRNRRTRLIEKIDGLLLLGVYVISPVILIGCLLGIFLWYLGEPHASLLAILLVTPYSTLGNFAIFYEITAAALLDGASERIRLLPFVFLGFLVSLFSVSRVSFAHIVVNGNNNKNGNNRHLVWDKTERANSYNGYTNGSNANGMKGQAESSSRSGRWPAGEVPLTQVISAGLPGSRPIAGRGTGHREGSVFRKVRDISESGTAGMIDDISTHLVLAACYEERWNFGGALEEYGLVLKLDPGNEEAMKKMGALLVGMGRSEEAERVVSSRAADAVKRRKTGKKKKAVRKKRKNAGGGWQN